MNQQKIVVYPNKTLSAISAPVEVFDEDIQDLVQDLFTTLKSLGDNSGIGMSAPQLGVSKRVSVVHVPGDEYGPKTYINPVVISRSAYGLVEESCLSVPGIVGNVIRATVISVEAQDSEGNRFESDLTGMHAVCLLHEIDHLDGKLFIDRMFWIRRWLAKQKLKKQQSIDVAAVN